MVNRRASVCAHMHAYTYKARLIYVHTHIYRQINSISVGISGFSEFSKSDPQFTLDGTQETSRGARRDRERVEVCVQTAERKFCKFFFNDNELSPARETKHEGLK